MPSLRSTILKAVAFLGLAWSAQVAIAALPSGDPELSKIVPAVAVIVSDPLPAPAPQLDAPALPEPAVIEQPAAPAPLPIAAAPDPRQVECMAKVILHEAGARAGTGQIAVAQVVRARVKSGRFAADACGVAKQRGQFFDVDAYNPPRGAAWTRAVAVATDALNDVGEQVAPGALFFHSAAATRNLGAHVRVALIDGNVFYR